MGSLRAVLLSGVVIAGLTGVAKAADLLPPAPRIEAPAYADPDPEFSGWYIRGDVGIGAARTLRMRSVPDPMTRVAPHRYSRLEGSVA